MGYSKVKSLYRWGTNEQRNERVVSERGIKLDESGILEDKWKKWRRIKLFECYW